MVSGIGAAFDLQPKEAVDFFRSKGFQFSFDWAEMLKEEHDANFTVAKITDLDLLKEIRDAVDQAISEGTTFETFKERLIPTLQEAGWWGGKKVLDADTGEEREVQLGSPRRLRTIFETNLKTAYAAGRWQQIQDTKETMPYLMYEAVKDDKTRDEHLAWDGITLPVDDDWWKTHYPPNGWNCRCSVIQVNDRTLTKLGKDGPDEPPPEETRPWLNPATGEEEDVPVGIDPGWDYAPGMSRADRAREVLDGKLADEPSEIVDAVERSMEKFGPKEEDNANSEPDWTQINPTESETLADMAEKTRLAEEIADSAEVADIPIDMVQAFNKEFKQLIEEEGLPRLKEMFSTPDVGFILINENGLYINPDFIRKAIADHGSLENALKDAKARKIIFAGNIEQAAIHEGAHYFELHKIDLGKREILKRAFDNLGEEGRLKISVRANKNEFELFAEVVTMLRLGERDIPQSLIDDLREVLP